MKKLKKPVRALGCPYCNYLPCAFKPRHFWERWWVWKCHCGRMQGVYGWTRDSATRKWNRAVLIEEVKLGIKDLKVT